MKIELYIDKQLCDIGDPDKFSVTLKRQLYNPSELNTKDAQVSYTITLPTSNTNNRIFGYANVEEVKGKFERLYDAELIVNGIRIFEGKFKMSEIDSFSYKGNLGVPAQKTVKEIFGDKNMNEAQPWEIEFGQFEDSVSYYNNKENAECIFPYVLYGLLPKRVNEDKIYTSKEEWDETVRLGVDSFPPSINCLQAIKHIFEKENLKIFGTAFDDARLTQLYMSYKNPGDYEMLWNYGLLGRIDLSLDWSNYKNLNTTSSAIALERTYVQNKDTEEGTGCIYIADLLSAINTNLNVHDDPGYNIIKTPVARYNTSYDTYDIFIPYSGLYKIEMSGSINIKLYDLNYYKRERWEGKDLRILSPFSSDSNLHNRTIGDLKQRRHEIKLLRDRGQGGIDVGGQDIDRNFYKDNLNQTNDMAMDNPNNFPKYYPQSGEVVFVDPGQNKNMLCGLSFGQNYSKYNPYVEETGDLYTKYGNPIVAKNGYSWDYDESFTPLAATSSPGYIMYSLDDEGENILKEESDRFAIDMDNAPANRIHMEPIEYSDNDYYLSSEGDVNMIVWLEKGERLSLVACADQDKNMQGWHGALMQDIHIDLKVTPFRTDKDWLFNKMGYGDSSFVEEKIDWNDESNFLEKEIDLAKFLPSDVKIDNWLENFCKAFNLSLEQIEPKVFELNVKQNNRVYQGSLIDLDSKANVEKDRSNNTLNLPSVYEIGFTMNEDEEGYAQDEGKKGIGRFETGSISDDILNQTSSFSYSWYKDIVFTKYDKKVYKLPVITENEVWKVQGVRDYAEMMKKYYSSLAQRFWFKDENLQVTGFGYSDIHITLVKNELQGLKLTYEPKSNSILTNYFTVLASNSSHYTEVECYLTPEEYYRLPDSLIKFNGDLYYPAEIDGYDPQNMKKAKLKLIRKII